MKTKLVYTTATIVVLFIGFTFYQSLVVIPREEIQAETARQQSAHEAAEKQLSERKVAYETCISDAFDVYSLDWDNQCRNIGEKADCNLTVYQASEIERRWADAKDACVAINK